MYYKHFKALMLNGKVEIRHLLQKKVILKKVCLLVSSGTAHYDFCYVILLIDTYCAFLSLYLFY